jgi:dTDP-4-amino-4,6-dideoxygalactose transaminase
MNKVPFFRALKASQEERSAIDRVLQSGWYILGEEVKQFEAEFSEYCRTTHCIALATGTDALEIGLRSAGVERGDKVVTVANAGFYTSAALHQIGATPLYADIDAKTHTMSADSLMQLLVEGPKAVVFTHLYGNMGTIQQIADLARERDIVLIEDCAQAHGAHLNGTKAGNFGAVGCFSFYPTKNLGGIGDGGAMVTSLDKIASRALQLRQYGWSAKYVVSLTFGKNSRLDEIQAAVLRIRLKNLDNQNAQRQAIANQYSDAFSGLPITFSDARSTCHVYHLYVIQVEAREEFRQHLEQHGVATEIHYPILDSHQPAFSGAITKTENQLEVSETVSKKCVSLPCFPGQTQAEVKQVVNAVTDFF